MGTRFSHVLRHGNWSPRMLATTISEGASGLSAANVRGFRTQSPEDAFGKGQVHLEFWNRLVREFPQSLVATAFGIALLHAQRAFMSNDLLLHEVEVEFVHGRHPQLLDKSCVLIVERGRQCHG